MNVLLVSIYMFDNSVNVYSRAFLRTYRICVVFYPRRRHIVILCGSYVFRWSILSSFISFVNTTWQNERSLSYFIYYLCQKETCTTLLKNTLIVFILRRCILESVTYQLKSSDMISRIRNEIKSEIIILYKGWFLIQSTYVNIMFC